MPDTTIAAPVAANPIDRLTLVATDARAASYGVAVSHTVGVYCNIVWESCMAGE